MKGESAYFRNRFQPETFYMKHKYAIWFYGAAFITTTLGIVPWLVGWYHIIF